MLERLAFVGDIAALYAEQRPLLQGDPLLTATEVLEALRFLPDVPRTRKLDVLRSLLQRMGKLEAYFLAKLLLRKAGFGFEYQGPLLAKALADHTGADVDDVAHAVSLTDAFVVADTLTREGPAGLKKIKLQPLVPVRPALASGTVADIKKYPVWVERKYDGIRLMLHKQSDSTGAVLCGAYTRTRGDWLELAPGLDVSIRGLPARTCIVDGELYGLVLDGQGQRPASVYEVYSALQGQPERPVQFRFAAFDLLYLDGIDWTGQPLRARRQRLQQLVAYSSTFPVPITLADGQLAESKDDVSRLYNHFRHGGYEGVIAKDLDGPYLLSTRDPSWVKRKPEMTLDLVLLQGVLAVTTKERTGMFGSFAIGARAPDGSFVDVGDVAGVDREREQEIVGEIMREGLITGRRTERPSASGVRPGLELRPSIVVTVKFDGITKDLVTKRLALRDPKIAHLRNDKVAAEADTVQAIEEIALRERVT
jgi:DNA ligase-1